jgi:hypothetical protein
MSVIRSVTKDYYDLERIRIIGTRDATPRDQKTMSQKSSDQDVEMLSEYDLSEGVRGKYYEQYKNASNCFV